MTRQAGLFRELFELFGKEGSSPVFSFKVSDQRIEGKGKTGIFGIRGIVPMIINSVYDTGYVYAAFFEFTGKSLGHGTVLVTRQFPGVPW
jgi:hypothetical protein